MANIPSELKVLRSAIEQLLDELARLSAADWETPNACGDWTVAETVVHLTSGTERYELWARQALQGDASPPPGVTLPVDPDTIRTGNRQRVQDLRRQLGDVELGARFRGASDRFLELLEGLRTDDWSRPTFHPIAVIPLRSLMQWRLAETALHRWDILQRLGREAGLPDGSQEVLLDWLPRWLQACYNPTAPLERPLHLRFELAAPISRSLDLTILGDRFETDPAPGADVDVTLRLAAEPFVLLMAGRRRWREAIAQGLVEIEGDREQAATIENWFGAL